MRAGFPVTMAHGGTSRVTTAPAPISACEPMVIPGMMVAFAPMDAPALTVVTGQHLSWTPLRGSLSLVKVALGPTNTSSSSRMPSHT